MIKTRRQTKNIKDIKPS